MRIRLLWGAPLRRRQSAVLMVEPNRCCLENRSGGNLARGFESLPRRLTPSRKPMVERNTAARHRRPQRVAMTGQLAIRARLGDRDHRPTIAQPIIRDDLQLPGDDRSIDHTRSTASSDTTPYARGSSTSARHGRRRGGDLGFARVSYAASCQPFAAARPPRAATTSESCSWRTPASHRPRTIRVRGRDRTARARRRSVVRHIQRSGGFSLAVAVR